MKKIPMSEVETLYHRHVGGHWFDIATMKFFESKLPGYAYVTPQGNYFISQERNPEGRTAFTIRLQDPVTFKISTVGEFHAHLTVAAALEALAPLLREAEHA